MSKKITTSDFIKRSKQIHGEKYDYSKVEYVNSQTKVCIICPEHGEFWQNPSSHLNGCGCSKCSNEKQSLGEETFIAKAKLIHCDKYNYSKVKYVNSHIKVCIICPEHGEFWQKPNSHLSGDGCPKCSHKKLSVERALTRDEWIKKARFIHGDKYDYSKVEYVNNKTKVCIICPEHGEFWQKPDTHLRGSGCPKCSYKKLSAERTLTSCEWIKKARLIHGDKYDYSKVEYCGYNKPVCIICPVHGEFWQLAYDHLHGKGCPKCKMSHLERRVYKLLTDNNINFIYNYKPAFLVSGRSHRSLDFYLPEFNIAIECQGIQHFSDAEFYKRTFNEAYERDLKKYNDCKKNNIKLFYFSNFIIDDYIDKVFNFENELLNEILKYGK